MIRKSACIQELADQARPREVQDSEIQALDLAEHRGPDVRSPAVEGQLGGGENATGSVAWVAELHRPP